MITVKGIPVRSEEINLEVDFQDLTEEGQRRIFLENQEEFILEALASQYVSVVEAVREATKNSSFEQNRAIEKLLMMPGNHEREILEILKIPEMELEPEIRVRLVETREPLILLKIARDVKTSMAILKMPQMFAKAIRLAEGYEDQLLEAILANPNFVVDKEIEKKLSFFPRARKKVEKMY